jgi:hypothetical protein
MLAVLAHASAHGFTTLLDTVALVPTTLIDLMHTLLMHFQSASTRCLNFIPASGPLSLHHGSLPGLEKSGCGLPVVRLTEHIPDTFGNSEFLGNLEEWRTGKVQTELSLPQW